MRSIEVTYDIVTEESAEYGDFAEHGWANPPDTYPIENGDWQAAYEDSDQPVWSEEDWDPDALEAEDVLEDAANFIAEYGPVEPSGHPFQPGDWYTQVDGDIDEPRYSFHLKGFTKDEEEEVYGWLKASHAVM